VRDQPSAWKDLLGLIDASPLDVRTLAPAGDLGARAAGELGLTQRSYLGAMVLNTGGIIVDHGWLRIHAGGGPDLLDVLTASEQDGSPADRLVVAHDVMGGLFAIDGGSLGAARGEACYWGSDTLEWLPLGLGHADLVTWALSGDTEQFYADLRWPGWRDEVEHLALDHGISCYPFPCTVEGQDIARTRRTAVPLAELWYVYGELARQLGLSDPRRPECDGGRGGDVE